jgi:acetyl-CoA carboxylase biotin carboxylase subunit
LRRILIANRGEIAVRVIRACRDLGLGSVAVYSACDRASRHVRLADAAYPIGPDAPVDSYLSIARLLDAARACGADAVHPGYGFMAENAAFADACRDAGLTFIGPTPEVIALMGSKTGARHAAAAAGVPVVPGTDRPFGADAPDSAVAGEAARLGYPVLLKAVAGGGGKGMRLVASPEELPGAIRAARSEARAAFGDAAVYLERRLARPRHIEVQLLGDQHGTVLPFVERECSIQRRHQKVIEETPSPAVSAALRRQITGAAAAVARAVGYTGAGTIEFLLDEEGRFFFLEMNTRLQVEHPITELVTGVDLVEWQIRIARGERLDVDPAAVLTARGHAIECRIYAEDPDAGFMPSPGRIAGLTAPGGPFVRDDSAAEPGGEVPIFYDPLISKLSVWGTDRRQAMARMRRALAEYDVEGIRTTIPFFRWMLDQPAFQAGAFHTAALDELLQQRQGAPFSTPDEDEQEVAAIAAALHVLERQSLLVGRTLRGRRASVPPHRASAMGTPGSGPPHDVPSRAGWKRQARIEALRA